MMTINKFMPAEDDPAPGLVRAACDAFEAFTNPKAVHARRKADRLAALAEGRKALARLKSRPESATPVANAPHLDAAIAAIETLEAAVLSLDAIAHRLDDAGELVAAANMTEGMNAIAPDAPDPTEDNTIAQDGARALLAERYDELRDEIDRLAHTAYAGRTNLLDGLGGTLEVPLDASGRARALIPGADATSGENGLALPVPAEAFAARAEREAIAQALAAALQTTRALAARFEIDAALLAARIRDLPMHPGNPHERRP